MQKLSVFYLALHKMGFAHSFEVWEDKVLIGGLYGIKLGGAFFENPCSRVAAMPQKLPSLI